MTPIYALIVVVFMGWLGPWFFGVPNDERVTTLLMFMLYVQLRQDK